MMTQPNGQGQLLNWEKLPAEISNTCLLRKLKILTSLSTILISGAMVLDFLVQVSANAKLS